MGGSPMTPDELSERLLDFSARIGNVVDALPGTKLAGISRGNLYDVERQQGQTMMRVVHRRASMTLFASLRLPSRSCVKLGVGCA